MNKLLELIDGRIYKKIKNTNFLTSVACVVEQISSDEAVTVSLVSNGTTLTVPNYSGSSLEVGESVQLFYFGNMITDKNAYIGASLNKGNDILRINRVPLNIETGDLTVDGVVLGYCNIETSQDINVALNFNATVLGSESSNISFKIYINNIQYDYEPIITSHEGEYNHISFSLQIDLTTGLNAIIVQGVGAGTIINAKGYVEAKSVTTVRYRRVEYIQSTGTQYILTDIIPSYDMKAELDMKLGTNAQRTSDPYYYVFGISGSDNGVFSTVVHWAWNQSGANTDDITFYHGWRRGVSGNTISNAVVTSRNTLTLARPQSSWGTTNLNINYENTAPTPSIPIAIFGVNYRQGVGAYNHRDMYVYSFKVYDGNNVLLHELIPVERQLDGELGLYDTITGKFYINAGTGAFLKGNYID